MNIALEKIKNIPAGIIVTSKQNENLYTDIFPNQFIHNKITNELVDNILCRQLEMIKRNKYDPRAYIIVDGYDIFLQYKTLIKKLLCKKKCHALMSIIVLNPNDNMLPNEKQYFDYVY